MQGPVNLHTFEAVLKRSQNLFWTIGSKYLTVFDFRMILFFLFFHNRIRALFLNIWFKFLCIVPLTKWYLKY